VDDSPAKAVMDDAGYFELPKPREQLIDFLVDPTERMNFSGERAYAGVYRELAGRLERWMVETDDPLRSGHVTRPPGSRINEQDARSAEEPTVEG
jgi:hypothetical protein